MTILAGALLALAGPVAQASPTGPDRPDNPRASKVASILYFHDAHEIGPVVSDGHDRGGVARLSTAIDGVRADNPATAVVFGGDLAGGSLFGGLYKGFPMVEAFNTIGVDLAGFGQHDFDFGVDNARELVAASDFPWITSNLLDAEGKPFVEDGTWAVQRVGKLRVGYIGLTDAIETTSAADQLVERDAVAAARQAVDEMTDAARVDLVVAVTQRPMADNHDLARAVPELDAVFGEEVTEYESVVEYEGDVPLMAAEGNMGSLIRLDVTRHRGDLRLTPSVVEVDDSVAPDPELRALEERYAAEMEENLSEVLATVATPLDDTEPVRRSREARLGNLVADAFRATHGTDVGWVNGGGLRATVPGPDFTLRDAYSVAPFDNKVMAVDVTGARLRQALEQGVARVQDNGGGFPQVSGLTYTYAPAAPVGSRVAEVRVGGEPLDPAATYSVAVTNYVVGGGDGVTGFDDADVLVPASEAPSDAEAIAVHVRGLGVVDVAIEGRIVVR
jgi:5'-nucleotidase